MSVFVLSVWPAGEVPPDGGAPIRLRELGAADSVAEHDQGFDTADFVWNGAPLDPLEVLTESGLLRQDLVRFVGEELWRRLTPGVIDAHLTPLLKQSRIYLDLRADRLRKYPWEVLSCRGTPVFTMSRISIGRPEPHDPRQNPFAGTPPAVDHPLRLIVAIGDNPQNSKILADEELDWIDRRAHIRNPDVILKTLYRPEPRAIQEALRAFKPHVFHFIGHGDISNGNPVLQIWGKNAQINESWSADRIRDVFSKSPPRVVVLNACLTAAAAQTTQARSLAEGFLSAGCISVLAMMGEIRGDASVEFSRAFYQGLFEGEEVDSAAARARLEMKGLAQSPTRPAVSPALRSNWPLPRLIVRGDAAQALRIPAKGADLRRWQVEDFVDRWEQRWDAWSAFHVIRSRLVVLTGDKQSGKSELLKTIGEVWARWGGTVINVDVSLPPTGDWLALLGRITDSASRADDVDADELRSIVNSGKQRGELIPEFLDALERCAQGDQSLLVNMDGLSEWDKSQVEDTVLPEICSPYVRTDDDSRVHMMIALREPPDRLVWGAVPPDWGPIHVGSFSEDEWKRAVRQLASHWRPKVAPAKLNYFETQAGVTEDSPVRQALELNMLRQLAKILR